MPQNRLNLNFKLDLRSERLDYVRSYLSTLKFEPTSEELDLIAKYILWGKNDGTERDGVARLKSDGVELESRRNEWNRSAQLESLDELLETPGFNEAILDRPVTRKVRETFSRSTARKTAPTSVLAALEALWRSIDTTELETSFYDLAHAKRTSPIRPQLLSRFSAPEIEAIRTQAASLTPFKYLKLRHELVELRQEQYTLKDTYSQSVGAFLTPEPLVHSYTTIEHIAPLDFIAPASSKLFKAVFNPLRFCAPNDFSEQDLKQITKFLWTAPSAPDHRSIDFTNPDHLNALYILRYDLEDLVKSETLPIDSNLESLLKILECYESLARLEPIHLRILELKAMRFMNQQISDDLKANFGKLYHPNYISTLYWKKCIGEIAEAAKRHRVVVENLCFPENFKQCKDCGEVLLMDEISFVKRSRSKDGFSPRCKRCEKIKRDARS